MSSNRLIYLFTTKHDKTIDPATEHVLLRSQPVIVCRPQLSCRPTTSIPSRDSSPAQVSDTLYKSTFYLLTYLLTISRGGSCLVRWANHCLCGKHGLISGTCSTGPRRLKTLKCRSLPTQHRTTNAQSFRAVPSSRTILQHKTLDISLPLRCLRREDWVRFHTL